MKTMKPFLSALQHMTISHLSRPERAQPPHLEKEPRDLKTEIAQALGKSTGFRVPIDSLRNDRAHKASLRMLDLLANPPSADMAAPQNRAAE